MRLTPAPNPLLLHGRGRPSHCIRLLVGSVGDEMQMLPVLVKALNDQGHKCELITNDGVQMKALMLEIGKGDHAARMKKTATAEKTAFDPEAYIAQYPELSEEKTYVWGFTFVPSTTLAVNKLSEINEHMSLPLHPVYEADFGHLGGPNKGVYGVAGRLDVQHHWVPAADVMCFANESGRTWKVLLDTVNKTDKRLNVMDSLLLADGDKGMKKVVNSPEFGSLNYFLCALHRGKNVAMSPGGAAAKAVFDKLVHCPQPQFEALEKRLTPKGRQYLSGEHDRNQYMSQVGGCLNGHYTSNAAESMEHAALPVRQLSPFAALLRLLADQKRRYDSNAAECVAHHAAGYFVPPRVYAACEAAYEEGKKCAPPPCARAAATASPPPPPRHSPAQVHRRHVHGIPSERFLSGDRGVLQEPGHDLQGRPQTHALRVQAPGDHRRPVSSHLCGGPQGRKGPLQFLGDSQHHARLPQGVLRRRAPTGDARWRANARCPRVAPIRW